MTDNVSTSQQESLPLPEGRQLIRIDANSMPSVYSNSVHIRTSIWDILIDFGQIVEADDQKLVVRSMVTVAMSPQHAKAFSRVLSEQVALYEKLHGVLPVPEAPPPEPA